MLQRINNLIAIVCLSLSCLAVVPHSAFAHGEKALEPFIRMRTIQWYDVQWSQDKLAVNGEVAITGKFHVA